jgi:hypothetical protein
MDLSTNSSAARCSRWRGYLVVAWLAVQAASIGFPRSTRPVGAARVHLVTMIGFPSRW